MKARLRLPLAVQVFLVLLLGVVVTQALNVALLLASPPPPPPRFSVTSLAAALRTGQTVGQPMTIGIAAAPPAGRPASAEAQASLSRQLGVTPDRIILVERDFRRRRGPPRDRDFDAGPRLERFEAALRLPDGRWRIVTSEPDEFMRPWTIRALLWLAASLLLLAPLALWLSRRLVAPLGRFAEAADRLGRDPGAPPLPPGGPAEIAVATDAFNRMQQRLAAYVSDRTRMVGAIAHDLRTPLTRLAFRLEDAPEALRKKVEPDIEEMRAMLAAALGFVRDLEGSRQPRQRLSLRSLVESIADDHADMGDDVTVEPGDDIVLTGDVLALRGLVMNLIGNAVKYGGTARISLARTDDDAVLRVEDDGPGIPAAEQERVFEPFYRGEYSRNRDTGGVGLGLATVRAVARAHGGDVTLANRAGGGLTATARLPIEAM